jgi:hypothetical protein
VDARIWREFGIFFAEVDAQNLFDVKYFDSKGAVCPGRFITADIGVRF